MTYKNAKTILFAGLIAAMILPFSGMNFAEAETTSNSEDTSKKIILPGGHIVTEDNIIRSTVNDEGKVTTLSGTELPSKYFIIKDDKVAINLDVIAKENSGKIGINTHGTYNGYNMLAVKDATNSFTYFNGYWEVPNSPTNYISGGTIYTFDALQLLGGVAILQPILQYGDYGVCGSLGDNWNMAPMAVVVIGDDVYGSIGECIPVNEGDLIRGTISESSGYWTIEIQDYTLLGYPSDAITPIYYSASADQAGVALETYNLPTYDCGVLSGDIEFMWMTITGTTIPNWVETYPDGTWCGMDINIVNESNVQLNIDN